MVGTRFHFIHRQRGSRQRSHSTIGITSNVISVVRTATTHRDGQFTQVCTSGTIRCKGKCRGNIFPQSIKINYIILHVAQVQYTCPVCIGNRGTAGICCPTFEGVTSIIKSVWGKSCRLIIGQCLIIHGTSSLTSIFVETYLIFDRFPHCIEIIVRICLIGSHLRSLCSRERTIVVIFTISFIIV